MLATGSNLSKKDRDAYHRDTIRKDDALRAAAGSLGKRAAPDLSHLERPAISINRISDSSFTAPTQLTLPAHSYVMIPISLPELPGNIFAVDPDEHLPEGVRIPPSVIRNSNNVVPLANYSDDEVVLDRGHRICSVIPVELTTVDVGEGAVPWDNTPTTHSQLPPTPPILLLINPHPFLTCVINIPLFSPPLTPMLASPTKVVTTLPPQALPSVSPSGANPPATGTRKSDRSRTC